MITYLLVDENGDLELPLRPRRRIRLTGRRGRQGDTDGPALRPGVPTELSLSTLIG